MHYLSQVTVARQGGKTTQFQVVSRFKRMVQTLRYKKSPYTARSVVRTPGIRRHLVTIICKDVQRECETLTARSGTIGRAAAGDLKLFEWKTMEQEMMETAPTLLAVLKSACATRRSPVDMRKVYMAAAVLLKGRNKNASLVQNVVSVLLYAGHCSKRVSTLS